MMIDLKLADLQRQLERAQEFRQFRRQFLFSQSDLAARLGCSRRTVCSVELAETLNPHPNLLKRFRALKQKCERKVAA